MDIAAAVGMSEREFWESTPRYLAARQRAWKVSWQTSWEQTRFIATWVAKTVDHKNKFKRYTDLIRFDWEKNEAPQFIQLTDEEAEEISREMDAALKVLNPKAYEAYMQGKTQN